MTDYVEFLETLKNHYIALHDQEVQNNPQSWFSKMKLDKYEGYSHEEIEKARIAQKVPRLPRLYVEFMRTMGIRPHYFQILVEPKSMRLSDMKSEKRRFELSLMYARKRIRRVAVPKDMFIFAQNGRRFWFFRCDNQEDDPPVFFYEENFLFFYDPNEDYSYKVADRLSDWLMNQMFEPMSFVETSIVNQHILHLETDEQMLIRTSKFHHKRFTVKPLLIDTTQVPNLDSEFGDKLVAHYRELQKNMSLPASSEFVGLSLAQIKQITKAQGVSYYKLPLAFHEYLRVMGANDGGIFQGADRGLRTLLHFKTTLREMLRGSAEINITPKLPKDAIVFLSYQDVEYFWFEAHPDNDDPKVMVYIEDEAEFLQVADHLSVWLWTQAHNPLAIIEQILSTDD